MIGKRPREEPSHIPMEKMNNLSIPVLVDELRAAAQDQLLEHELKAKYIKDKLDKMSDDERLRFEFFMQSHFSRSYIRDIMQRTLKGRDKELLTDEMVISVSGLAKLFVGEVVDRAVIANDVDMTVSSQQGGSEEISSRCIQKYHIEEAYRQLKQEGKIGCPYEKSFLFDSEEVLYGCMEDVIPPVDIDDINLPDESSDDSSSIPGI